MMESTSEKDMKIEEILAKGTLVKFRVDNSNKWYTTKVDNVKDGKVVIGFPEMFAALDVILGDTMTCRFYKDEWEYSFDAEIESVKVYFPHSIRLKVIGEMRKFENARQSKREDTIFLANVYANNGEKEMHSCVGDVSDTGLKIISKFDMEEGDEVEIHVALPVRNIFDSIVKLKGKIMRCKKVDTHNEYGVAITEINDEYRLRLVNFLDTYTG